MTPPGRVAAVIPHWNRVGLLESLLAQLPQQTRRFDRIIVIDNGSTDGSAEVATRAGATVIRLPTNQGFAAAVNQGIAEAVNGADACDWIAILNNDVTLEPAWLERLLAAAQVANASFATGRILSSKQHAILDGTWDEISRGACPVRCGSGLPDGPAWSQTRPIRFASMTAAIFRRELFAEVGTLDEGFVSYLEDIDFGLRCAKAGRGGVYEPDAIAYHQGSSTWGRWNPDTVRMLARNQMLLVFKHFRGQPVWPSVAGQLLWGLVALRRSAGGACGSAWLRGKLAGWKMRTTVPDTTYDKGAFRDILASSEAEIARTCSDSTYWRLYFWLTRSL